MKSTEVQTSPMLASGDIHMLGHWTLPNKY